MREAPDEVSMTFSEPLDPSSHLEVTDQCGRVVSGDTEVAFDEMSTELTLKPKGHYTVDWTATGLAGASGTNEGSFAFHVYQGDSCDPDRGGKGNHNHNNGGPKNNNNHHGGNNKHRGGHGNGPGGDHNDDHSSTAHSSTEHSSETHSTTDQGDHSGAAGHKDRSRHGDHRKGKGSGHGKHEGRAEERGNEQSDPDGRSVGGKTTGPTQNDALNLLLVLLLPALLGTTGGAVLRARTA
ncbi:MAG: copper resistance protein CopC [Actinomycetota bacterium]|nr:copper resistance protein CopC [Actinomycetota bacterium]